MSFANDLPYVDKLGKIKPIGYKSCPVETNFPIWEKWFRTLTGLGCYQIRSEMGGAFRWRSSAGRTIRAHLRPAAFAAACFFGKSPMFELRLLAPEDRVETLCDALDALQALNVSVEDADADFFLIASCFKYVLRCFKTRLYSTKS